jgi:dipeptidyl aminopeptidase/acylaminoacyl peptidase
LNSARPLRPADLLRQVALGDVALAPDGGLVCYTLRRVVAGEDRAELWLVPYDGGRNRRLTHGHADRAPRFSPDGSAVAFLSDRGGGQQVHVIPVAGGESRQVTTMPRGVAAFDWCPDGRRLVVAAEDPTSRHLAGEAREGGPTARVITRLGWRLDGAGLVLHDVHLHVVRLAGGRPRRLTSGPWSASSPRVSPDGREVAFLADRDPDADLCFHAAIHTVPVRGGEVCEIGGPGGPVARLEYAPDGALVCHASERLPHRSDDPVRVHRREPDGRFVPLTGADEGIAGNDTSDLFDWAASSEASGVAAIVARDGLAPVSVGGEVQVGDCIAETVAAAAGRLVAVAASPNAAPEVVAIEGSRLRPLTRTSSWLRGRRWPRLDVIETEGAGGRIRTFLYSPEPTGGALATVLLLHGGPVLQWTAVPSAAVLLLTAVGYRVATPNARGAAGRGREWAGALQNRWGDVDAADCHAVLDDLVERGLADPARLGVTGLSYGGFLTNWLIGSSDRFAAAVSENGVTNQVSVWAQCDVGPQLAGADGLGDPLTPEGVDGLWRQSPLRNVAAIRTPLLLLQGEDDRRCPPGDNEQLFVALRRLGREVEYVLYPESGHLYSAVGRPDRRVDRHQRTLDWFTRWMPA